MRRRARAGEGTSPFRAYPATFVAAVLLTVGACAQPAASPATSPTAPAQPTVAATVGPAATPELTTAPATPAGAASWVDAGSLSLPRISTKAVAIDPTRILVVGNDDICTPGGAGPDATITEVGDPAAGTWQVRDPLPRVRQDFALARLPNGSALLIGGFTEMLQDGSAHSFRSTYRFDVKSRSWQRSGDLNVARMGPLVAALEDGRILVAGGVYSDGTKAPRSLRSTEIFDPGSGTWSMAGELAMARTGLVAGPYDYDNDDGFAVTLADGRVLVAGGAADIGAELFDPTTSRWSSAAGPGFNLGGLVALRDGGALAIGGKLFEFGPADGVGRVARFDPTTLTWHEAAPTLGRFTDRTFVRLPDDRVLAAGGQLLEVTGGEPAFVADAEIYDPVTDRWAATAPLPEGRGGAVAVRMGDPSIVLVGGASGAWELGDPSCPQSTINAIRFMPGG